MTTLIWWAQEKYTCNVLPNPGFLSLWGWPKVTCSHVIWGGLCRFSLTRSLMMGGVQSEQFVCCNTQGRKQLILLWSHRSAAVLLNAQGKASVWRFAGLWVGQKSLSWSPCLSAWFNLLFWRSSRTHTWDISALWFKVLPVLQGMCRQFYKSWGSCVAG